MNMPSDNIDKYNDDSIDLGKIFRLCMMQSKLIALIIFLITSISIVFYLYAERTYKITSLLQVTPKILETLQSDFTVGSTYTQDTQSTQQLYKSRSNILTIIDDLDLNIEFEG